MVPFNLKISTWIALGNFHFELYFILHSFVIIGSVDGVGAFEREDFNMKGLSVTLIKNFINTSLIYCYR